VIPASAPSASPSPRCCGWAGSSARPALSVRSAARIRSPTAGLPAWNSWRWPSSSGPAATTSGCGGYATRRDFLQVLAEHAPDVRVTGLAAGFHAVAHLSAGAAERKVICTARARSVGLYGMSTCRATPRPGPPKLVLGFTTPASGQYRQAGRSRGHPERCTRATPRSARRLTQAVTAGLFPAPASMRVLTCVSSPGDVLHISLAWLSDR